MKLLFIANSFENGAIPHILLDLAPVLRTLGWQVTFLTIEPLPQGHHSVIKCLELGFVLHTLNLSSKTIFLALFLLNKAIKTLKPDLIHTHLGRADIFTALVKGKIPQVTTFHSVRKNYNWFTLWGYKATDRLVAHRTGVSKAAIDSFYLDGFLQSKCSVITSPINHQKLKATISRDELQERYGWSFVKDFRLVSLIGRLIPVKAHSDFIDAFPLLLKKYSGICAVIVGQGKLKATLEQKIKDLKLQERIKLISSWEQPADWYTASNVLVFPSLWEGLGLVPLEAMILGCPVASSRIPAVEEFLIDKETGRLFEPQNPASLALAVSEILDHEIDYRRRLQVAQAKLLERFSPQRIAAQYHRLYTQILGIK